MSGTNIRGFAVKAFAAMAALSAVHGTSIAQTPEAQPAADQPESDIMVEAPRPVPVPTPVPNPPAPDGGERNPYSGAPIIVTTVRLPVLYSDLDLKNPADAERLMTRIDRIGRDACQYLDRLYPLNADPDCFTKSVGKAKEAAKAAIAAASK